MAFNANYKGLFYPKNAPVLAKFVTNNSFRRESMMNDVDSNNSSNNEDSYSDESTTSDNNNDSNMEDVMLSEEDSCEEDKDKKMEEDGNSESELLKQDSIAAEARKAGSTSNSRKNDKILALTKQKCVDFDKDMKFCQDTSEFKTRTNVRDLDGSTAPHHLYHKLSVPKNAETLSLTISRYRKPDIKSMLSFK